VRNIAMNMTLPISPNLYETVVLMKPECHTPDIHLPFLLYILNDRNFNQLLTVKGSLDVSTELNQMILLFFLRVAVLNELYTSLTALHQLPFLSDLIKSWMKSLDKQTAVCSALTWRATIVHQLQSKSDTAQQELVEAIRLNRTQVAQLLFRFGSVRSSLRYLRLLG
jgi:hypothetical protein